MYENYLAHYGVLGMKWGRRKKREKAPPGVNNRVENLTDKYKREGLSDKDARHMAEKRAKVEKKVKAVAGVALVGIGIYAGYKIADRYVDKSVKSGGELRRIMDATDSGVDLNRRFYTSVTKGDHKKYLGRYAGVQKDGMAKRAIMEATKNIKVPSPKKAESEFIDLVKTDSEFRKILGDYVYKYETVAKGSKLNKIRRAKYNFHKYGTADKHLYDHFNAMIIADGVDDNAKKAVDIYFNRLKSKGYGAVLDVNDMKISGYKAKRPLIVFNSEGINVKRIDNDIYAESKKQMGREITKILSANLLKRAAIVATATGAKSAYNKKQDFDYIKEYRKKHPNSRLTDSQIVKISY